MMMDKGKLGFFIVGYRVILSCTKEEELFFAVLSTPEKLCPKADTLSRSN